jgi:ubiquinone/menaquinone biosynthesis C-methylase UbiE
MEINRRYYTTGEFAKRANVSIRTIRYYDKVGILKPTVINESGYRLYSDSDSAKLQKILSLKFLGYSLEDITDITKNDKDSDYIKKSLQLQLKLIQSKMEHMKLIEQSIIETTKLLDKEDSFDWNRMVNLIQVTNIEKDLYSQYKDSKNTSIRIKLHENYKANQLGWYEWIYSFIHIKSRDNVLEIGCGNGELWRVNKENLPDKVNIILSDISPGMIHDAKENIEDSAIFSYQIFDCNHIPYKDESFDIIIANHMLFYLKDRESVFHEIKRVLKPGGTFICSTYGKEHMKEISELVKEYDQRIMLSNVNLYEIFGLDNGKKELEQYYDSVEMIRYNDYLKVNHAEPLCDYIMSCHGNQLEYIKDDKDFSRFIERKLKNKGYIKITKDAGIFKIR